MDGQLEEHDGQWQLRFQRELAHPIDRVWRAVTENDGLAAWFPFAIDGERRVGARLSFREHGGDAALFEGEVVAWEPPRLFAFTWGDGESIRLEVEPQGDGCILTLVNQLALPKAARDAAGWHTCLDALDYHLRGEQAPWETREHWAEVHPRYVASFPAAASAMGPPEG